MRSLWIAIACGALFLASAGTGCDGGGGTGPALKANPPSLSFEGIQTKETKIEWGGFNVVVVAEEKIIGSSSFQFAAGKHCEIEFKSGTPPCVEKIKHTEAAKGQKATLVLENQYGNLEIPLTS